MTHREVTADGKRTVILGLGNSIVCDDAVGLLVARSAASQLEAEDSILVRENERGGMDVLDAILPFGRAVIVDAIKTGRRPPGSIYLIEPTQLPPTRRLCGLHDLDLPTALELAAKLEIATPAEIFIVAVEIVEDLQFGEECTPDVQRAIRPAAETVLALARGEPIPSEITVIEIKESTHV